MVKSTGSGNRGRLGGILFGGIFAAIGVGFLLFAILPTLYQGWQMRSWQPARAEILDTRLNTTHGNKSTTYRVTAHYRYHWQGRDYTGSRVGIGSGSDNIGDWHQQHYYRFKSARDKQRPVTVWVDPAAPQNAVIDREIRWGLFAFKMVFVVAFGGAGIGIIIFMLRRGKATPASATPWLENPEWRNNRIRSGGKALLWFLWIFGIVWLLFMIPLLMNADKLAREGMPLSLMPYLFPLIGVAVLLQALIKTLRWRRFGSAVVSLNPFPGVPGRRVGGRVELPLNHREQVPVEVTLSCVHVYWRRRGGKHERQQEIVWQDSQQARLQPGARGAALEFDFKPPAETPSSSEGSDYHTWTLTLRASMKGPDLDHSFTIPVFADESSHTAGEAQESLSTVVPTTAVEHQRPLTPESLPSWLRLNYHHGGIELFLPMFRNLTISLVLLVMGLIFGGAGLFMLLNSNAPMAFSLIFVLVGALMLLGGLYAVGNSQLVHVSSRGVAKVIRIFGVPVSRKIPAAEIVSLDKRIGAQSGNRAFYRIYADTRAGKRVTLADSLPSASAADYLIEQCTQQLHLKPGGVDAQTPEAGSSEAMAMARKAMKIQRWVKVIGFVIFLLIFGEFAYRFLNL